MACSNITLAGLTNDCMGSKGGLKEVAIVNYSDVENVEVNEDKLISAITLKEGAKFKKYFFKKGNANFTSTLNVDNANGVNYVSTDLVLTFLRMENVKRLEMTALSLNELAIIVLDANGKYWYLGKDEAVTAINGSGESGSVATDGSKYVITLQDTSDEFPHEIDSTIVADLIG